MGSGREKRPMPEIAETKAAGKEEAFNKILEKVKSAGGEIVSDEISPFYTEVGSQEFEVGVGGTLFTAKTTTAGANVGVSNQSPTEKFHVNSGDSSFVITGFGTVGVGTVAPAGDWIKGNSLFSDGAQGKLKLDVSETIRIGRNIYDSVGSPGENDFWLKRDEYGIRWQPTPPTEDAEGIKLQDEGIYLPIGQE